MKQDEKQPINWYAEEGKVFKRKIDGFIMGESMQLGDFIDGTVDTIENYEEVDGPDYEAKKAAKEAKEAEREAMRQRVTRKQVTNKE